MAYLPPLNGGRLNASISGAGGGSVVGGALISTGTLNLVAGSNITLSQAGGNVTIQAPSGGGGSIQFSAGGNSSSLSAVNFSASNGIGFGLNGSIITASHNGLTSQSGQAVSGSNGSFAFQTLSFSNANNVSFGTSVNGANSAVTASISTSPSGIQGVSAGGSSQSTGSLTFLNANGVGFGLNNGSLTASYTQQPMFDGGMLASANGGATAGVAGVNTNGIGFVPGRNITMSQATDANGASITMNGPVFSNSNNINFGTNGSVITASYAGGGGVALSAPGSSFSSGTVNFGVTNGALSIAGEGGSVNFAAPNVSSIVGVNGINVAAGGNTISIDGAGIGEGTIDNWEPMPIQYGSVSNTQKGNGTVFFYKLQPQANVQATRLLQLISMSATYTSNSSYAGAISIAAGIYTANGSTLSMINESSGSQIYRFTNTSNNSLSLMTGLQGLTMPLSVNFTPGNYWLGMWSRTSYTNAAAFAASNIVFTNNNSSYQGIFGVVSNATEGLQEGVGYVGTSSTTLPSVMTMSRITQSLFRSNAIPYLNFKNVTY